MLKLSNSKNYNLIENDLDIALLEAVIASAEHVAFDTETNGLNTRKHRVIGFSFSTEINNGYYIPLFVWDKETQTLHTSGIKTWRLVFTWLKKKKLIMHNGPFDTKICFNNLEEDLLACFHADTQLMRHTLQEEGPFALKDIAVELSSELGISADEVANQEQIELEENVKANGGSWTKENKEMFKADLNVLAKYACADTDLCLRLFYHFEQQLLDQDLHSFFYEQEVMPVCRDNTIPMEFEGLHLHMEKLNKYNDEITKDIAKSEKTVTDAILNSAEGLKFIQQRCAEEAPVTNKGNFAQAVCEYYGLNLPKTAKGKYSINAKALLHSPDNIATNFLRTGNRNYLSDDDVAELQLSILKKDGPLLNINSKHQLATLVFDIMQIEPLSKTPKGNPQFNEDTIEYLAADHGVEWAKELRVYNKMMKTKTGYYDRFLENNEDGIFYPSFKQHGTISGRYGSDLQQLSRPLEDDADDPRVVKYTNTLRELIIPKPGYAFLDADYESLEPRCFAADAGDPALIEIFDKDEDFYSKVGIKAENIQDASADKKAANYLKNTNPTKRQNIKAYALGIRYGMKAGKLAKELNISTEEAQEIIDGYFKAFPNLKKAMDNYLEQAKETGMVRSKYGRVRHMPMAKHIYKKYGDAILDYKNLFKLAKKHGKTYDELKTLRKVYNNLLNNALNFPIQTTAASIVNRAMRAMTVKFREQNIDAWVSLQIHDQIVVSCALSDVERAKLIVQDCMENTNKLSMKLVAVPQVAFNLREGH